MKVHFIGIGGIGVSALAQYYLAKGYEVSGSDLVFSEITELLEKKGIKIIKDVPEGVDLIIHTPAAKPEPIPGVKIISYPEALGELTKEYFTIAVSGTHGKSTTTSMIGLTLIEAGFDPTVIVGTKLKEFGDSNFREGKSKYLVIEADEWNFSFLNYWPKIIVLTNIEEEHLDTYRDLNHILNTFKEYISHLDKDGILIINGDDKNISRIKNHALPTGRQELRIKNFSLEQKEAKELKKILRVPGEHNVYNALAALTLARSLNIPDEISFKALSEYQGVWRRFDIREAELNNKKLTLIHDYAHHPTEVEATLKAAKEKFPDKKIWCVFQPHQHQRTFYLFDNFVKVLSETEIAKLIIIDIYDVAGRERGEIKEKVDSKKLVDRINKLWVKYLAKEEINKYLEQNIEEGQILIIMGAGNVYKLLDNVIKERPA
ncbi:MAG: UDP-N-acetylmuramate--L-alanine ligase [bacterium]|nr:UDP-N-acetylmuramate--L-alanine ligase [bacterium]